MSVPGTFLADPALYPDPSGRAARVCAFLRHLVLWEGPRAGERLILHPFQEALIRAIYGPVDDRGRPAVRDVAIWAPRGAGKTALVAGLALAHLVGPVAEAGGQIILGAASQEQAGIAYRHVSGFAAGERRICQRLRAVDSRFRLHHRKSRAILWAVSHEADTKQGLNASFFLADEIHAWPDGEAAGVLFWDAVTKSMAKRETPLVISISTAGAGAGGWARRRWDQSWAVARGEARIPGFLPIIFAADPGADYTDPARWDDPAVWCAANPAIVAGFLFPEQLVAEAATARRVPLERALFLRYRLNIWQDAIATAWLDLAQFDAQDRPRPVLDGLPCWVGVDVSATTDLTAVVAVFPDLAGEVVLPEGGSVPTYAYDVVAHFWLPEAALAAREEADRAPYEAAIAAGALSVTPGNAIDHGAIVDWLRGFAVRHTIREIVKDRWNSAWIGAVLADSGVKVIEFGQGFASMSAPLRELRRAFACGHIRHGGNPLLRYCFANALAERDSQGNEKFAKEFSRGRIDGAVALAMGVGRSAAADITADPGAFLRRYGLITL